MLSQLVQNFLKILDSKEKNHNQTIEEKCIELRNLRDVADFDFGG